MKSCYQLIGLEVFGVYLFPKTFKIGYDKGVSFHWVDVGPITIRLRNRTPK